MFSDEMVKSPPLRWGMVGGGTGSQIGYIHRCSAQRDNNFELVAGAFDIVPERGVDFGKKVGVQADRCYPNYVAMFEAEAKRADGIEAVSIATPNHTHFEISVAALNAGLHVICEKPLCFTTVEAKELQRLSKEKNRVFAVSYGYAGTPILHQAKKMIENGDLGEIRIVQAQFAHGFHSEEVEKNDPGTKWRVDPKTSGPAYVLGDTGTHALYLIELLCPQLKIEKLLCSRQSFVKSRAPLEDNAFVMMNYESGAVGTLWSSAVNAGSMHQQKIRVIGSKASVEWWDEHPNQLSYQVQGKPEQIIHRGMGYIYEDEGANADRIGGGHAEGLFESWANLYYRYGLAIRLLNEGKTAEHDALWYPNVDDGLEGIKFVEKCVESADNGSIWINY